MGRKSASTICIVLPFQRPLFSTQRVREEGQCGEHPLHLETPFFASIPERGLLFPFEKIGRRI